LPSRLAAEFEIEVKPAESDKRLASLAELEKHLS
jgi:hypothetical protein